MRIHWVNHASYILEGNGFALLTDPWIMGTAFNKGWSLLTPTVTPDELWAKVTHIYFSHEHPDHFHPPSLKALHGKLTGKPTVIYQESLDKRVVGYCRDKLGFNAVEVPDGGSYKLSPTAEARIGQVPFYDSWIHVRDGDVGILNVNDCVIASNEQAERIHKQCGKVDVLLTQFGYANWEGNPEDAQRQIHAAAEKIHRVGMQIDTFKPKFYLPFATFIYFSHAENNYLNAHNTAVKTAVECGPKHGVPPVLLKPGDVWEIGSDWAQNETNLAFYDAAAQAWASRTPDTSDSVTKEAIDEALGVYNQRLKTLNQRLLLEGLCVLRFWSPITFYVTDLDMTMTYRPLRSAVWQKGKAHGDVVALASDSLHFLFKWEYGFDTLLVNGRFRASAAQEKQLLRNFGIGSLNNMGKSLSLSLLFDTALWKRFLGKWLSKKD